VDDLRAAEAVLDEFRRVITRNRGHAMAPISELPCSREDITRALELLRGTKRSVEAGAALVELESFVADTEAHADRAFESYYAAHPRARWRDVREQWRQQIVRREEVKGARLTVMRRILAERGDALDAGAFDVRYSASQMGSAEQSIESITSGNSLRSDPAGLTQAACGMLPLSAVGGLVTALVGLWLLGKSLWWAPVALILAAAVPMLAVPLGEALAGGPFWRSRRVASLIEGTILLAILGGWLVVGIAVAALAP
jgi:hypothetical protein